MGSGSVALLQCFAQAGGLRKIEACHGLVQRVQLLLQCSSMLVAQSCIGIQTGEIRGSKKRQQLLQARRLCEAGCGFVNVEYGGWDMHGQIKDMMNSRAPELDHALATLVEDMDLRGLNEKILVVLSGEFGRTPKINGSAGRDHWAPLSTLALAGGGLKMGQVVGESAEKADVPKTTPITPLDLVATVYHVLGIDRRIQFTNTSGRPTYMVEGGRPIEELV